MLAKNLFSTSNLLTIITAAATGLLFSQSVVAQSFSGYCISQKNNNPEEKKQPRLLLDESSSPITVTRNDRIYAISVDNINQRKLLLKRAGEQSVISQTTLSQEGGQINNLILGEDNWLWIDRNAIDYIMKINFAEQSASFDPAIKLPELSAQPCHFFRRLFKKCRQGEYSYSSSLNRVFVSGYPTKSWRKQIYLHWEFVSGDKKSVPESLVEATFIADISEWNGALFQGKSGEALFYDGTKVINLSQDFLRLQNGKKFQNWDIRKTAGGRSFLGKFVGRTNNEPLFLMELKSTPGLKPVYLPKGFNSKWLELVTFPQDPKKILWIFARKAIFAEVKRKVQTIVRLPQFYFIKRLKPGSLSSSQQNNSNSVLFTVGKDKTKSTTDYLLLATSADADCETVIDIEKATILKLVGN